MYESWEKMLIFKNKNIKKLIFVITIMIIILFIMNNMVLGASIGTMDLNSWKPGSTTDASGTRLQQIGNSIIGILQVVGSISSVIALIIMGIKYMVGSVEERAEYKKTMLPYFIGAIMVFAITNVLAIVSDIMQNLI